MTIREDLDLIESLAINTRAKEAILRIRARLGQEPITEDNADDTDQMARWICKLAGRDPDEPALIFTLEDFAKVLVSNIDSEAMDEKAAVALMKEVDESDISTALTEWDWIEALDDAVLSPMLRERVPLS